MNTKLNDKLNTANVANNLTTTSGGYALDARQGKALNDAIGGKASIGAEVRFGSVHIGSGDAYIYPGDNGNLLFRYGTSDNPQYMSMTQIHDAVTKSHNALKVKTVDISAIASEPMGTTLWIWQYYGTQNKTTIGDEIQSLLNAGYTVIGGCFAGGGLNDQHTSENAPCWDIIMCSVTYYINVPYNWGFIARNYETIRWKVNIFYY